MSLGALMKFLGIQIVTCYYSDTSSIAVANTIFPSQKFVQVSCFATLDRLKLTDTKRL